MPQTVFSESCVVGVPALAVGYACDAKCKKLAEFEFRFVSVQKFMEVGFTLRRCKQHTAEMYAKYPVMLEESATKQEIVRLLT
jgi:hypothetical protein